MPFITEEIWQTLEDGKSMIITSDYPVYDESLVFAKEESEFEKIIAAIRAVRNRRNEMNVVPSVKAKLFIETEEADLYKNASVFFEKLASASEIETGKNFDLPNAVTAVTEYARIFIPLEDLVDKEKELARLNTEKKKVQKDLDFLEKKLSNQGFLAKAPAVQVEKEKEKLAKAKEKMAKIELSISQLS
jgi:valyl-tRNA synthetase